MEKYYTTLNCLKQAIQPRVVGPLLQKKGIDYIVIKLIGFGCGTSMGYVFCVGVCDPTGSHMYVTRLV